MRISFHPLYPLAVMHLCTIMQCYSFVAFRLKFTIMFHILHDVTHSFLLYQISYTIRSSSITMKISLCTQPVAVCDFLSLITGGAWLLCSSFQLHASFTCIFSHSTCIGCRAATIHASPILGSRTVTFLKFFAFRALFKGAILYDLIWLVEFLCARFWFVVSYCMLLSHWWRLVCRSLYKGWARIPLGARFRFWWEEWYLWCVL